MLAYRAVVFAILQFYLLDGISGDLQVKMAIFSGRVDPQWSVISTDPKLVQIQNLLNAARKGGLVYAAADMPARLGYKGFLIQNNKKWELIVGPKTVQLQLLLFQSMPEGAIPAKIIERTKKVISAGTVLPEVKSGMSKRHRPPFNPGPWMNDAVRDNNNCYNYANIQITNTFAQPGRGSGAIYADITDAAVRTASVNDGLVVAANSNSPAGSRHVVALVVEDDVDFHWYLKDGDGKWSHKPGETSVTRKDDSGNLINDPAAENCDKNGYVFVCYMTTDRNTVNIN